MNQLLAEIIMALALGILLYIPYGPVPRSKWEKTRKQIRRLLIEAVFVLGLTALGSLLIITYVLWVLKCAG